MESFNPNIETNSDVWLCEINFLGTRCGENLVSVSNQSEVAFKHDLEIAETCANK